MQVGKFSVIDNTSINYDCSLETITVDIDSKKERHDVYTILCDINIIDHLVDIIMSYHTYNLVVKYSIKLYDMDKMLYTSTCYFDTGEPIFVLDFKEVHNTFVSQYYKVYDELPSIFFLDSELHVHDLARLLMNVILNEKIEL